MKFTVKDISCDTVTVEYEDKTTAVVPIIKGWEKKNIQIAVANFNQMATGYDSVEDVPVAIGEELETLLEDYEGFGPDQEVTYKEARRHHYPDVTHQLDAAYWLRNGDDTQQKAIDATIKLVKDTIPKTWKGPRKDMYSLMD